MPKVAMKRKTTGWTTVALGDVAINSTAATQTPEEDGFTRYIIGQHIPGDGGRITTWGDVGDGEFGSRIRTIIRPGDIVCTTRGPKIRVAVATFDCLSAHTNFVLRTSDAGVMLQEYLQALACSDGFQEHLRRNFRGSTNLFVNWSDAAKFQFALPPIEEQRRIAGALQAAEASINELRKLGVRAADLRASAIDDFTFGVSVVRSTVGSHCEMQNGRPFPAGEYCDDGELLLRPGNLAPCGYLTWDEGKTRRVPHRYREEASDFVVAPGNVLINLTAQSLDDGFMGRVCLVRSGDESLLNQRIGRFRNFSDQLLPEFLFRVLQSSKFRRHAVSMCEGSKIKHLFWQHIEYFELPLPTPTEQARIVEELRRIDAAVVDIALRLRSSTDLKSQLLGAAFHDDVGSIV